MESCGNAYRQCFPENPSLNETRESGPKAPEQINDTEKGKPEQRALQTEDWSSSLNCPGAVTMSGDNLEGNGGVLHGKPLNNSQTR